MYWVHLALFPPPLTGPLLSPRLPLGHPLILAAAGKISLQLSIKSLKASQNIIVIYFPPLNSSAWDTHTRIAQNYKEMGARAASWLTQSPVWVITAILYWARKGNTGPVGFQWTRSPVDKRRWRGCASCLLLSPSSILSPNTHSHAVSRKITACWPFPCQLTSFLMLL